ncbi:DMT family transporter [Thalassovita sp.]|uniref:DMT family transporter n=1 Tax=Thalassovita sp. TaxID=1979401 RepID=UPI002882D1B5|nr:DMT family transporter [Thalassovita sp.]MDF1804621.1 DMT family transporter [Thalassovita sp.]
MKLFLLTTLTMIAFAANSVLNRMGLSFEGMDPFVFGSIRLLAGALVLAGVSLVLRGSISFGGKGRLVGVLSLLVYIYGFSAAYVMLDAGLGALILFGTVQITMFAGALVLREPVPALRWVAAVLAFVGLCWLLWPVETNEGIPLVHGGLMVLAGVGWGVYSLAGRGAADALQATAANFLVAAPLGGALTLFSSVPFDPLALPMPGVWLAILSGAITSGLGYALWYSLLPALGAGRAAVAQLSVPVIAIVGGVVFLLELPDTRFLIATAIVLGGVALSLRGK